MFDHSSQLTLELPTTTMKAVVSSFPILRSNDRILWVAEYTVLISCFQRIFEFQLALVALVACVAVASAGVAYTGLGYAAAPALGYGYAAAPAYGYGGLYGGLYGGYLRK